MGTPVSGPGPFSQRTDLQPRMDLPNADYGEQQSFQALQAAAPMAADSGQPSAPEVPPVVGLGEPSQRPDEDIMTGVGTPPINYAAQDAADRQAWLPVLSMFADQQGASWAFRNAVRKIQAGASAQST